MDATEFTDRLCQLTGDDIADLAAALRHQLDSAEAEIVWWRATVSVTDTLRRRHRSQLAAIAAHHAAAAVRAAAERAGIAETARDTVIAVCRGATDVARAVVARGDTAGVEDAILGPWARLCFAAA
jgi:hypothetical protein